MIKPISFSNVYCFLLYFCKHSVNPLVILLYSGSASGIGIANNLAAFHAIFTNNITLPSIPFPIPTPTPKRKLKNVSTNDGLTECLHISCGNKKK